MGAVRVDERGHAVTQRTKALVDGLGLPRRKKHQEHINAGGQENRADTHEDLQEET